MHAWWWKMIFFPSCLIISSAVKNRFSHSNEAQEKSARYKLITLSREGLALINFVSLGINLRLMWFLHILGAVRRWCSLCRNRLLKEPTTFHKKWQVHLDWSLRVSAQQQMEFQISYSGISCELQAFSSWCCQGLVAPPTGRGKSPWMWHFFLWGVKN